MLFVEPGKLPTHLLLGERKAATSWIWKQFSDHPDVYVLPKKEIYFFNHHYHKGLRWYRSKFPTDKRVVMDTTPDYFFDECFERIKEDLPNAKLIVCLRHPIERAYSQWKFGCFCGRCDEEFIDAWERDWNRVRTRGLCDEHLSCFLKHYELGTSLLVVLYDDLLNDPLEFINRIYDYVGVPRHSSRFFDKKWMPGEVSETGTEDDYEEISNRRMSDSDYSTLNEYYASSMVSTEKMLESNRMFLSDRLS